MTADMFRLSNHNPVPSLFMTYHFRNKSNTTGATCGARTEYYSGARKSPTPQFQALSVIIGKKLNKMKRWPGYSLNHPL